MSLRYLSVCSGIEAASVAWADLGWQAVGFAEIEPFPSAVLAHHYGANLPGEPPSQNGVPNYGDFTKLIDAPPSCDILVGGTPCQAFSIAGKRQSLADERGNLTLSFVRLSHAISALQWAVWENVPGVLSTRDNAFGCLLGALVGADAALRSPLERGRWPDAGMVAGPRARAAWRVLDAQYFGLAQRRRRVFLVAGFADGCDPAAVLFEQARSGGHSAPGKDTEKDIAGTLGARTGRSVGAQDAACGHMIAGTVSSKWAKGSGRPAGDECYNLVGEAQTAVRRLTPTECERLQGFPDDYTAIPWRGRAAELCHDGPRYRALGNSMAVPVMRWLGERISQQHQMQVAA